MGSGAPVSLRGRRQRSTSPRREIVSAIGHLGRERGAISEELALAAAQTAPARVPWVTGARKGTPDEDRRGIDLVVETTLGRLCIQVKSSRAAARAWAEDHRHKLIEVVIASFVREEMEARLDAALWRLRQRVEARRAGAR